MNLKMFSYIYFDYHKPYTYGLSCYVTCQTFNCNAASLMPWPGSNRQGMWWNREVHWMLYYYIYGKFRKDFSCRKGIITDLRKCSNLYILWSHCNLMQCTQPCISTAKGHQPPFSVQYMHTLITLDLCSVMHWTMSLVLRACTFPSF